MRAQRRCWRPLGLTRLRGARVASLDRPVRSADGGLLPLVDTLGTEADLETMMFGCGEERVTRVLEMLRPEERRVALAFAGGYAGTWERAAVRCGMPAGFGERVRRKLKRKGDELTARRAAVRPRAV